MYYHVLVVMCAFLSITLFGMTIYQFTDFKHMQAFISLFFLGLSLMAVSELTRIY